MMTNSKKDIFSPETENWLKTRKANEQKLKEAASGIQLRT